MYKTANVAAMVMVTYYELMERGAGKIPVSVAWIANRFNLSTYRAKNVRETMFVMDAVYKDHVNGRYYLAHYGFFVDCVHRIADALNEEPKDKLLY